MKKLLLLALAAFSLQSAQAQLADGSQAPDFTFTDTNGNTVHLQEILDQGKTVIMDISAAWCGPCWAYHNSGALEEVYALNGPNGTCSQDVVVLFVEGELTNSSAQLTGTNAGSTYATASQGDWTAGTPYPIIDLSSATTGASAFMNDYAIAYFPTVYRICPNGVVKELTQPSPSEAIAGMESCPHANDARIEAKGGFSCGAEFTPSVSLKNNTAGDLISCSIHYSIDGGVEMIYDWSGTIAAGASQSVNLPSATLGTGAHTIEVTAVNPNSLVDDFGANNCSEATVNVVLASGGTIPAREQFSTAGFPYADWTIVNDDNGITWAQTNSALKFDCYNYSAAGAQDDFIPAPYDLSSVQHASLTFNVAHRNYSASYVDGLEVLVSTDCGANWTSVWAKEGAALATGTVSTSAFTPTPTQWRVECVDLDQYVGNSKVFVAFRGHNGYGNNIWVDDVWMHDNACALGVEENTGVLAEFKAFPNPTSGNTTISYALNKEAAVSIQVYNMVGDRVIDQYVGNQQAGSYNSHVDLRSLSAGLYLVNLNVDGVVSTVRLTVSK
jgi:hypothetical protein